MKSAITKFFSIFVLASYVSFCTYVGIASAADTASILPPAKTTYFDQNGKPLTAGTVDYYIPGTFTRKTTWQDAAETIPNTNPVVLDAAGRSLVLGSGSYRQIVKDKNSNTIWDQVTSSVGSGSSGGTAVGDGLLVGSTMNWAGFIAPPNWAFAYGQEVARLTYPELLAAITSVQAVFCTSGSPTLTGLSDTTQLPIGAKIEVSCLASGSTIISKTSSQITASNNAVTSTNTNATFYPWGNGNGTTTFNIPDYRDVVLAGRPNMGGTDRGLLTTAYYGANPLGIGVLGGSESKTLTTSQIPSHLHAVFLNDPGHTHTSNALAIGTGTTGGNTVSNATATINSAFTSITVRDTAGGGGTANQTALTGGGLPHSVIQPTTTTNVIIKVTPDVSTVIASGVASLGGMTGVIVCGSNVTCASNTISVTNSGVTGLNGLTGSVTLAAGTNISLTPVGNTITVASTGGTPGGSNTQVQYNNSGAFGASANLTWVSPKLTIGAVGTTGQFGIAGTTSGNVTQTVQATAGTPTITWGNTSGTPAVTVSAPLALSTTTGNLTITGAAGQVLAGATPAFTATPTLGASGTVGTLAFGNATSGTVTLGTVTGALGSAVISLPAATDTLVGKATTDTFTNKTYDTAGTGNSFSINGVAATANTGTGSVVRATTPTLVTPVLGAATGTSVTLTGAAPQVVLGANTTTLGSVKLFGNTSGDVTLSPAAVAGTATALTLPATSGTLTLNIASGTSAMGTSAIASAACATVVTTSATGTATTDVVTAGFNGDPTAVTGYIPLTAGMLTIIAYPTANNVNFKVCNNTASSITPGAITLNWRVAR